LFVCAKDLFDGANGKTRWAISAASSLAGQQKSTPQSEHRAHRVMTADHPTSGGDEQMFGEKQQVQHGKHSD
jgi:hypothetical protein